MNEVENYFSSTVIPTIGRPELTRAVQSVLTQVQAFPSIEVIVVNDSGTPFVKTEWATSGVVRIIETQKVERAVARNAGAAIAKGRYLHFLDDDDWVLPGFFQTLHEAAERDTHAAWIYGASQLVDRNGDPIIQLHHNLEGNCFIQVMAGEWIPLQSSIIKTESFMQVGGFNFGAPGIEDVDLARRISLVGDFVYIDKVIACIEMGIEGSTTNYENAARLGQSARETILEDSNAFRRMWGSAQSSYWVGRIARVFLTSAVWNISNHFFLRAVSRFLFGLFSFVKAKAHLFSAEFWRALVRQHESQVFLQGFDRAGRKVERRNADREAIQ